MEKNRKNKPLNVYAKYSGLAFQMAATIIAFVFLGKIADKYSNNEKPIFTAIFSVIGVFISLYNLIRGVKSNND
ncbi:MAG: AtpZ/AtpI family protein [Flavobacteriaceae bacterium]|jgi:F0F1-type ATP synthase assembly protein I|nr:AtpZ/AtpI family protein [Flavobacteriaceae bacterium]